MKGVIKGIFSFLGLGLIGYAAVATAANELIDSIKANYEGLPADLLDYMHLAGVDMALQMMLSALATSLVIAGAKKIGFVS